MWWQPLSLAEWTHPQSLTASLLAIFRGFKCRIHVKLPVLTDLTLTLLTVVALWSKPSHFFKKCLLCCVIIKLAHLSCALYHPLYIKSYWLHVCPQPASDDVWRDKKCHHLRRDLAEGRWGVNLSLCTKRLSLCLSGKLPHVCWSEQLCRGSKTSGNK